MLDHVVSYCDIGTIEEGREFRVLAIYYPGFESSDFVDRRQCLLGNFWVEFAGESAKISKELKYNTSTVAIFRGFYRCGGGYGHENFYDCQFTVCAVEKVFGETALPWE